MFLELYSRGGSENRQARTLTCFLMLGNLYDLDGSNTQNNYKGGDGKSLLKIFTYWQLFGLHLWYRHQFNYHINRHQYPISLFIQCDTKCFPYSNFSCNLSVTQLIAALVSGNFQNCSNVKPTLNFWSQLEIECTKIRLEQRLVILIGLCGTV